jgi:CRISPR-associated protein Csb2
MSAAENSPPPATTARWRLSRGIPLTQALRVGEQLQRAVLSCAARVYGEDAIPWVLSGHGVPVGVQHRHAFYLPEDADGDGWIDHLVVHAEAGLEPRTLTALGLLTHLVVAEVAEMWAGDGRLMRGGGTLPGAARWWVSATPYLPPRHRKKGAAVEDQVRLECAWRGLPAPRRTEELPGAATASGLLPASAFERYRSRLSGGPPPRPPHPQGWFFAVEFDRPITGPLALGYGCHFGLGLFRPVDLR